MVKIDKVMIEYIWTNQIDMIVCCGFIWPIILTSKNDEPYKGTWVLQEPCARILLIMLRRRESTNRTRITPHHSSLSEYEIVAIMNLMQSFMKRVQDYINAIGNSIIWLSCSSIGFLTTLKNAFTIRHNSNDFWQFFASAERYYFLFLSISVS